MKWISYLVLLSLLLISSFAQEGLTSEQKAPLNFYASIVDTFTIIFIAQIADKTFIMVIIFSMSMNRCLVYLGATITMVLMHTIATFLGGLFPLVFSHQIIKWTAVALFILFGILLIIEGCRMKKQIGMNEDMAEVKDQLIEQGHIQADQTQAQGEALLLNQSNNVKLPEEEAPKSKKKSCCRRCYENAFVKMAVMCFIAEFGDRSQITAVALAAANNIWGVWLGGSVAHICCTTIGVGCGAILAGKISPRILTIISGIVCLGFALEYIIFE